jgi:hypothetical protein
MRRTRTTWWCAFVAFSLIGIAWTMEMPLLFQPDEPSHAMRAAAVAQGELTWKAREDIVYENFFFVRRTNTVVDVPAGYATLEDIPICNAIIDGRDASCAPAISSSSEIVEARPYTGTYPPLTAIVQSPGGFFDAPVGLVVMRLCTLLVTALLGASAVVAATRLGGGFTIVGLALALTPVAMSLQSAINPSALELAAAACLWLSLIDVLQPGPVDRRAVWRTCFAAAVFMLSRPLSPGLLVVTLAVVMIAMPWRGQLKAILHERRSWIWFTGLGALFAFATVWIVAARPDQAVIGLPDPRTTEEHIRDSLSRIPTRLHQLVDPIGWLDIPLPTVVGWVWLGVGASLLVVALVVGSWRRRLALLILTAGMLLGPTVAEVPSAAEYGLIWQGRYTLPFAMGIPILAGWTLRERGLDRFVVMRVLGVLVTTAVVGANLLAVAVALTRHATGWAWPLAVEWGPQPWSADVRGWLVMTVAAVGLAALGTLFAVLVLRVPKTGTTELDPAVC